MSRESRAKDLDRHSARYGIRWCTPIDDPSQEQQETDRDHKDFGRRASHGETELQVDERIEVLGEVPEARASAN